MSESARVPFLHTAPVAKLMKTHFYYRKMMSRLTPERSVILSTLLNEVTGTEEAIRIRQDYCRIDDCIKSMALPCNFKHYFTGSKSEGLNLRDSDEDYMIEINDGLDMKVVQSPDTSPDTSARNRFYLCTKYTRPGFALLRCDDIRVPNPLLFNVLQLSKCNVPYLSSNLLVDISNTIMKMFGTPYHSSNARQGPSIESWHDHQDKSISGTDYVPSIHCQFWPDIASEWVKRTRQYGWPTTGDIKSIVDFGCHVVAIGYPHSEMKLMEWRLSFSIAERTLVWSFNHVQMQCYAVMKIILKEYIKENCSKEHQILCSYFIKTFLFWKFETTELKFWQKENFGECIRYLIFEFYQCLLKGELRHYFIPEFNLLSVKINPHAQSELLQVYDKIIQRDIGIMQECKSLETVWSDFMQSDKDQMNMMKLLKNARRTDILKTDRLLIHDLRHLYYYSFGEYFDCWTELTLMLVESKQFLYSIMPCLSNPLENLIRAVRAVATKTCFKSMFLQRLISEKYIRSLLVPNLGKEQLSQLHRFAHNPSESFDISSLKIWCAIIHVMKRKYKTALCIVEELESSIPSFALYEPSLYPCGTSDAEMLYAEEFVNSDTESIQRARKAWMFNIEFLKSKGDVLPLAIQIELYFCHEIHRRVRISPFSCMYYLMFLCYHELKQYRNRNQVLRELENVARDYSKTGNIINRHHAYNIAGHCLLIAEKKRRAREMFEISHRYLTNKCSSLGRYNSATWYLQNFC